MRSPLTLLNSRFQINSPLFPELDTPKPMKRRDHRNSWLICLFLALPLGYSAFAGERYQVERSAGGACKIYSERHTLLATGRANGSMPVGVWTYYESTGLGLAEIRYQRGIKNGLFKTRYGSSANPHAAGKLQLLGQFRSNQMDGLIKAYDSDGKPLLNRQYVDGKIVHAQTFFGTPSTDTPTAFAVAKKLDQSDQAFFRQIEPMVFDGLKSDGR